MKLYTLLVLIGFGLAHAKDTYIWGGRNVTEAGKWPWTGLVRDAYGRPECGITLISSTWGLTAARCTQHWEKTAPTFMFGSNDPRSTKVLVKHKKFIRHEDWNNEKNDIALVEFDKLSGTHIKPVPLTQEGREHAGNTDCWVSGFGTRDRQGNPSNWMKEGHTEIITNKHCKDWFGDYLNDGQLCNHDYSGAYPCFDDEGSPLVCKADGKFELVGVASWGASQCGGGGAPGVYSRVAYFRSWIKRNSGV